MLSLLGKLQRCSLTLLCDEAPTAHCTAIALHHIAAAAPCCFLTLEQPQAWFAQFPRALVVDGLALLRSSPPEALGDHLPLLEALRRALEGQAAFTVVLYSASSFLALYGAAALQHFCITASSLTAVRNVICVVHADAHPATVLACQAQQSTAVLMFTSSHTPSIFDRSPLQGLVPRPPPLPDVPYDVCGVALVRRQLQPTSAVPDDSGAGGVDKRRIGDRSIGRLLSLTEYFTVAEAASDRLRLVPVDWRLAARDLPLPRPPVTTGAPSSALEGLLGLQSHPEAPFKLHLTAEERRAKDALVLPSSRGATAAPTGVIYVDLGEFDDDLDDDLDI